jgi:primosomal replication protein N''
MGASNGDSEVERDGSELVDPEHKKLLDEHKKLYHVLEQRIRRFGEEARRQTGVHSLWFGYPLLYLSAGVEDDSQRLLAPVFLWPVSVIHDPRRPAPILIDRASGTGPPQFNRAMASWIERRLKRKLQVPTENELEARDWEAIKSLLGGIANSFSEPPEINCSGPLEAVPTAETLRRVTGPLFYHAAVLGYFQSKDEAILKDLDVLDDLDLGDGVAASFVRGEPLPSPPEGSTPPEDDRFLVTEADYSQERVIWKSRREPGMVVHGPPGTGKSQTIVNIIADALAPGRTILMVCQKQAATRVVMDRLKAVGLAELCMEVNDPGDDRHSVFQAIRNQVASLPTTPPSTGPSGRNQIAREIKNLEGELDRYAHALFEKYPRVGLSYREMKDWEGRASTDFPGVCSLPALERILVGRSHEEVKALIDQASEIGGLLRRSGALDNPWRYRRPTVRMSAALRAKVQAVLVRLAELDRQHVEIIATGGSNVRLPDDLEDFLNVAARVADRLRPLADDPPTREALLTRLWLKAARGLSDEGLDRLAERCRDAVATAERVQTTTLDPLWAQRCEGLDERHLQDLHDSARIVVQARGRWWRLLSPTYYRARRTVRGIRPGAVGDVFWTTAESLLAHVEARASRARLAALTKELIPASASHNLDVAKQAWLARLAEKSLKEASWLCREGRSRKWMGQILGASVAGDWRSLLLQSLAETETLLKRALIFQKMRAALSDLKEHLLPEALDVPHRAIESGQTIGEWIESVREGLERLSDLIAFDARVTMSVGMARTVLGALVDNERDRREGKGVPEPPVDRPESDHGRCWAALVRYAAATAWQAGCEQDHPELITITPDIHAGMVGQLRVKLLRKRALESEAIRAFWVARQVSLRNAPWPLWFPLRAGKKNGGAKTLREAVGQSLGKGLLEMRPCWLANPSSVSQVFPLTEGLFDLVIFDEASQCPVEQALPAIYRGKSLIVSGDEKQLPPTAFFMTTLQNQDGDEDDAEATDEPVAAERRAIQQLGQNFITQADDLLDAAVALFPRSAQEYLRVHYRSRHPALIAFSNHAFYGKQLEAPPAPGAAWGIASPIRYCPVDGTYRDRVNNDEARKVVDLLREYWCAEGNSPTIGVVTFNKPQKELIEDLIEEECEQDRQFQTRYRQGLSRKDGGQDVGFFVRNLENVQGDERDVLIFSTTFGRDPQGEFRRYFGPVGQAGGERRLNVAVTRARDRVIVVGSMPIGEVSTALAAGPGQAAGFTPSGYLQLYLAYAKAVSDGDWHEAERILRRLEAPSIRPTRPGPESPFEEEVLKVLEESGYSVACQVGDSGFRIDLAVRHRDPVRGYALGIECDGATYHGDISARARDVWREDILRSRGWEIHRIWSTRWWSSRQQEIIRLKEAVARALSG